METSVVHAQWEVHVELFLLCALLRLMLNRRWQNGESKKGWRPWPVVLAADFEESSPTIGEVAHCTEESRWLR